MSHLAWRCGRRLSASCAMSLVVFLCLVAAVAGIAPAGASPAHAVAPAADANDAVVQVYVGDIRDGDTSIAALPDAIFGLFAEAPDATINEHDGYVHIEQLPPGTLLFQCKSDADGDCTFTVPVRAGATKPCQVRPGNPRNTWPVSCQNGAGVAQGTRLWAAPITYGDPATSGFDYYANPWWQTAPLANTHHVSIRHTFQTPALVGGRSYESGRDWITAPGLATLPATPSTPAAGYTEFTRRVSSGGVWPLSRYNRPFAQQCGMNVALVVDVSSSIANSGAQQDLVDVMDSFVDALRGTPSSVALITFGTDSPAAGFPANTSLTSVATAADASAFKQRYAGWAAMPSWPSNYTNWDRGLAAAAAENGAVGSATHFDLVLFVTDGNPTVYGPNPLTGGGQLRDPASGYTRFRELGNGLASANLVKSQGTRVLAFGVGSGLADPFTQYNLRTISGQNNYPADTSSLLEADYVQTTDWGVAAAAMRDLVISSCAPSLSVVKRVIPAGGGVADAVVPPTPWGFTTTTATPGATLAPATPPAVLTDSGNGGISFDVAFDAASAAPATINVTEDLAAQLGYTPVSDATTCVERASGVDLPRAITQGSSGAFSVDVGLEEMVTCVVYNQAPPDADPASVLVHKEWEIHTVDGVQLLPDGAQPLGISAELSLSGPGNTTATPQAWGIVRGGYDASATDPLFSTIHISEIAEVSDSLPLCTLGVAEIKAGAPSVIAPYAELPQGGVSGLALEAGLNEWTVKNTVSCESRLTLMKEVTNGPLASHSGERLWELRASGPSGYAPIPQQLTGRTGDSAVTSALVVPGAVYELAERVPTPLPDHYMQHYLQEDIRSQPLYFPESSGSWACRADGRAARDPSLGAEGAIAVPLGMAYTCVAVNTTALLTVAKTVDGVPARDPSAWRFSLAANPPVLVADPQRHEFAASESVSVVPGQRYSVSESARAGFELQAFTCTSGGVEIPGFPADFSLLPGATAECVAQNVASPADLPGGDTSGGGANSGGDSGGHTDSVAQEQPDGDELAATGGATDALHTATALLLSGAVLAIVIVRRRPRGNR